MGVAAMFAQEAPRASPDGSIGNDMRKEKAPQLRGLFREAGTLSARRLRP